MVLPAAGGEPAGPIAGTTAGRTVGAPGTGGPLSPGVRGTTLPLIALITLVAFETMAVATAMPRAAADLGAVRSYGLAFSSFLTASMLGTVLAGSWCDVRGPRAPMAAGAALFVLGQLVCTVAPSYAVLLLGRLAAGAGGGLVVVAVYVVVGSAYSDALRPKVFGWISAAWVLPGVVGPALAGAVADSVGWRWVFACVVPVAVVVTVLVLPRISASAGPHGASTASRAAGRVRRGVVLAGGAGALQVGAEGLTDGGALHPALLVAGVVAVALALPGLLPPGTLRGAPGLPGVIAVRGLFTGAFFGIEAFVPLMLITERGLTASQAGLALTGATLGWTAATTVQTRTLARWRRESLLVLGGGVLTVAALGLSAVVLAGVAGWWVLPVWALAGFGMGFGVSTTSVLTLRLADPAGRGVASSALQLSDNLGSVLGIAISGSVFAALHDPGHDGTLFAGLFAGLSVLALAAAVVAATGRAPRRVRGSGPASSTVEGP